MSPYNPYANAHAYKNVEVNTSNRVKIVVMIYDAAVASLKQAIVCHKRHDTIKRNQYISRVQHIIYELNNSLDMDRGKDIAATLRKLYHFLTRHLADVMNDNDIKKVEDTLRLMTELRDAWHDVSAQFAEGKANVNDAAVYHGPQASVTG